MKKILALFYCVILCLLISGSSGCSYHSVQPEADVAPKEDKVKWKTDAEEREVMHTESAQSESAQTSTQKETARQQVKNDSSKTHSSDPPNIMSEQELEAVTESASSKRKKQTATAGLEASSEQLNSSSEVDENAQEAVEREAESNLPGSKQEDASQESGQRVSTEQKHASEHKAPELVEKSEAKRNAQSSEFKQMPEELDDGSEGELSHSSDAPLVSDEDKPGNSNINRKGRDTYLMEDGRPKRFWNLQRQL